MTHRSTGLFATFNRHGRSTSHRTAALDRAALAHDLAAFNTKADLAELAAILDRHTDTEAGPVRDIVDWSRAA